MVRGCCIWTRRHWSRIRNSRAGVFVEEALEELSASIKQDGVQEPVLVRQVGDKYELISGERRVRASIMADVTRIPAGVSGSGCRTAICSSWA